MFPTSPFTILEAHNQEIGEFYVAQEHCEAPKLWKNRSGWSLRHRHRPTNVWFNKTDRRKTRFCSLYYWRKHSHLESVSAIDVVGIFSEGIRRVTLEDVSVVRPQEVGAAANRILFRRDPKKQELGNDSDDNEMLLPKKKPQNAHTAHLDDWWLEALTDSPLANDSIFVNIKRTKCS